MYNSKNKENNSQKKRSNPYFKDHGAKEVEDTNLAGSKVKTTQYSDGSTTYHFGGPVGDISYDEYGNEC
jgi:hypothetical protein